MTKMYKMFPKVVNFLLKLAKRRRNFKKKKSKSFEKKIDKKFWKKNPKIVGKEKFQQFLEKKIKNLEKMANIWKKRRKFENFLKK